MKLAQAQKRLAQHVMLFGYPKTGKSTLAAQLAEEGFNLLWLSLDNGHTILDKLSPEAKERVELVVLKDTKDFPVAATTINILLRGGLRKICDAHGQINCGACLKNKEATWTSVDLHALPENTVVVIDHISQLAESVMANLCLKDFAKDETYKFTFNDYGAQGTMMARILGAIQHSPFHVICIAHSLEVSTEDGGKLLVPQVGTRAFSDTVGKFFDHIIFAHISNGLHRFGIKSTYRPNVLTGSRTDAIIEDKGIVSLAPIFRSAGGGSTENNIKQAAVILEKAEKDLAALGTPTPPVASSEPVTPIEPEPTVEPPAAPETPEQPPKVVLSAAEELKRKLAAMKGMR